MVILLVSRAIIIETTNRIKVVNRLLIIVNLILKNFENSQIRISFILYLDDKIDKILYINNRLKLTNVK